MLMSSVLSSHEFDTAADAKGDSEDLQKLRVVVSVCSIDKRTAVLKFCLGSSKTSYERRQERMLNAEKDRAAKELHDAESYLLCNDLQKERAVLAKWAKQARGIAYGRTEWSDVTTVRWPKVTVTHMMSSLGTMQKLMSYYRELKLADHLNDEDLRFFLEEQLCKEKAGLSEIVTANRLNTRKHVPSVMGENHDGCSICMVDYKEQDKIASLYYCTHEYHEHCIKEWLLKSNICPMCRALAIIPEEYPSWQGDVKLYQAFFVHGKFTN